MKKNKDELLQKQNDKFKSFEELLMSYVELENRIKALEENVSKNNWENKEKFHKCYLLRTINKGSCYKKN